MGYSHIIHSEVTLTHTHTRWKPNRSRPTNGLQMDLRLRCCKFQWWVKINRSFVSRKR